MTWAVFKQTANPEGEPFRVLLEDEEVAFEPGKYSIWSTTVDSFVVVDATRDEIIGFYVDHAEGLAVEQAKRSLSWADGGEHKERPGPASFEEALREFEQAARRIAEKHDRED